MPGRWLYRLVYTDLTLQKDLAYESATDIVFVPPKAGIGGTEIARSEYWLDDGQSWMPRQLTMYSLHGGDPNRCYDNAVVQFDKPEFVSGFDGEIWTEKGLSLPSGQPLADLRIKDACRLLERHATR